MTNSDSKRKQTPRAIWKSSLIPILIANSFLLLGVATCQVQNPNPNAPGLNFRAKLYSSDAKTQSIVRKDSSQPGGIDQIKCDSPRFSNRVCVTIDEYKAHLQDLNNLSYQCVEWRQ